MEGVTGMTYIMYRLCCMYKRGVLPLKNTRNRGRMDIFFYNILLAWRAFTHILLWIKNILIYFIWLDILFSYCARDRKENLYCRITILLKILWIVTNSNLTWYCCQLDSEMELETPDKKYWITNCTFFHDQ